MTRRSIYDKHERTKDKEHKDTHADRQKRKDVAHDTLRRTDDDAPNTLGPVSS